MGIGPFSPSSLVLFLFLGHLRVHLAATFTLFNNCEFTVSPIISGQVDSQSQTSGFNLESGEDYDFTAPSSWRGSLWGRNGCSNSLVQSISTCATGGCTNNELCDVGEVTGPVTAVGFKLNQDEDVDFYSVSLVRGYNLPVLVAPQGGLWDNCSNMGCVADLNEVCPSPLQLNSSDGEVIGCQSACQVFRTDEYCCPGASCGPTEYSRIFKTACPYAYSYPKDDQNSMFTCKGADYKITFCPGPNTGIPTSPPPSPGHTPLSPPPSPRHTPLSPPPPSPGHTPLSPPPSPGHTPLSPPPSPRHTPLSPPPSPRHTPLSPPPSPGHTPLSPPPSQGSAPPLPHPSPRSAPLLPPPSQGSAPPLQRPSPLSAPLLPPPSPSSVLQIPSKGMNKHTWIGLMAAGVAMLLILCFAVFIMLKTKQGKRKKSLQELQTFDGHTDVRQFTYESILSATNNLASDNKLGEGGYGSVYKGRTPDGQDIAVKCLSRQSRQGVRHFETEIKLICKLQHVNLVKLIGLCIDGEHRMIIYDYMPNKSLDFFLFGSSNREQLRWWQRFNIIEGIAQGLLYLHKYSPLKIIHRDLKPSNILLDENMNAKISDFGLARVFEQNMDETNTTMCAGTYGYMAPEYAMHGKVSVKLDVYSFGVLVLEIVSGLNNNCFHDTEGSLNLVEHAWELWRKDSYIQLMDQALSASCDVGQWKRCIHIALLCVENQANDRPTMEDVVMMLKNGTASLRMPKEPSSAARNEKVKTNMAKKSSVNEVTLSDMEAR